MILAPAAVVRSAAGDVEELPPDVAHPAATRAKKKPAEAVAPTGFYYLSCLPSMKSSSACLIMVLGVVPAAAAAALIRSA